MIMARVKLGLTQTDAAIIVMSLVAVAMTGYVMILGVYGVHPITTTKKRGVPLDACYHNEQPVELEHNTAKILGAHAERA